MNLSILVVLGAILGQRIIHRYQDERRGDRERGGARDGGAGKRQQLHPQHAALFQCGILALSQRLLGKGTRHDPYGAGPY